MWRVASPTHLQKWEMHSKRPYREAATPLPTVSGTTHMDIHIQVWLYICTWCQLYIYKWEDDSNYQCTACESNKRHVCCDIRGSKKSSLHQVYFVVCKIPIHTHIDTIYGHILSYLCTSIHRQDQTPIHDSLLSTTCTSSIHTLPQLLSMQDTRHTQREKGMAIFEHELFTNMHVMT